MSMNAYAAAAKVVLRTTDLYALKWRQHGLGMLQGEINEELRVHIWHPKLRTLPFEGFRDVHDHRFTLTSYVAVGQVVDIPFTVVMHDDPRAVVYELSDEDPEVEVFEIVHAKEQENVRAGCSTATLVKPLGKAWVRRGESYTAKTGTVYSVVKRDFHTTRIDGLAITVVHRSEFDGKLARVLGLDAPGDVGSAIVPETLDTKVLKEWVLREATYAVGDLR